MRALLILLLTPVLFFSCKTRTAEGKDEASATADNAAEFADARFTDIGRRHMTMFQNGNIEGWAGMFANNVVFYYSGGDSLVGKKALIDYWTNRRANVIESLKISNDIWLPVKVNKPQQTQDVPGVWLFHWHQFDTKYKNGNTLTGWVHTAFHFDDNEKVDRAVQFLDRAPIQAASGVK
jgi:hypothetical protein